MTNDKYSRSDEIFAILKHRILHWAYPPGYRLTEESLCAEFGVSRIPVREALRMLEENNLVEKVPHRGCTVRQPNLNEINELYEVRLALELYAVERLAQSGMEPARWFALYETWQALAASQEEVEIAPMELARLDAAFHEELAAAVGNQSLADLLRVVDERLFFTRIQDITTLERLQTTCRQHLTILERIQQGDPAGARAAMRANIEYGRHNVEAALKEALAQAFMRVDL